MKEIATSININAPAEKVWDILTDFGNYKNWNPFIIKSEGKATQGSHIVNQMVQKGKVYVFRPRLTIVKPNQQLEWYGSLSVPGLFGGRHSFVIEQINTVEIKLVQKEIFNGLLSGMILKSIGEETRKGFEAMNEALKKEAEK